MSLSAWVSSRNPWTDTKPVVRAPGDVPEQPLVEPIAEADGIDVDPGGPAGIHGVRNGLDFPVRGTVREEPDLAVDTPRQRVQAFQCLAQAIGDVGQALDPLAQAITAQHQLCIEGIHWRLDHEARGVEADDADPVWPIQLDERLRGPGNRIWPMPHERRPAQFRHRSQGRRRERPAVRELPLGRFVSSDDLQQGLQECQHVHFLPRCPSMKSGIPPALCCGRVPCQRRRGRPDSKSAAHPSRYSQ